MGQLISGIYEMSGKPELEFNKVEANGVEKRLAIIRKPDDGAEVSQCGSGYPDKMSLVIDDYFG